MTISATTQGIKPGVCTSTNRPSAPFDGQVIYMTDVDQTAVWDGTQWTVLAPIAGGRNSLINGGMDIYQRGSISAAGYALDRWYFSTYGTSWNSLSVTQQTSGAPTNFRYYMRVAAGSATSTNISFGQSLETHNVIKLAGKVVNLSFYYRVNTNFSTAFTVTPVFTTGTDANISTVPNGTAIGSSQTVTNTTAWTRFSYSFTVPSNATSFAIQFWNNGNTVSTASLDITGVQVEAGAVATPFEFEDYSTTLAKCQRYYETSYNGVAKGTSTAAGVVYASSSTDQYGSYILPSPLWLIPKRTTPSVTTYSQAGTINKWNYYRSGVSDQEINVNLSSGYNSPRSTLLYISTGVAFVSATGYGHFVADAEL